MHHKTVTERNLFERKLSIVTWALSSNTVHSTSHRPQAYPGFYNGGGSRGGGQARRSGDGSPPVGSRGKVPVAFFHIMPCQITVPVNHAHLRPAVAQRPMDQICTKSFSDWVSAQTALSKLTAPPIRPS